MAETVKKLLADAGPRDKAGRALRDSIEDRRDAAKAGPNFGSLCRRLAGANHAAG